MSLAHVHLYCMLLALTVDFILEQSDAAAEIVSRCEKRFQLRKRWPAAETEITPPDLHKDSLEENS